MTTIEALGKRKAEPSQGRIRATRSIWGPLASLFSGVMRGMIWPPPTR